MAEGGTDRLTLLNWPSLLVFVLLSWGFVLVPPPMKSLRPASEPAQPAGPPVGQLFESRLWQDPFDSLSAARKPGVKLLDLQQAFPKDRKNDKCILILPVFLPGSQYPEDVENRLRSRYAVVSALAVSGYIPEDGGDIRCFTSPWPICATNSEIFPYELFEYVPPVSGANSYRESLNELTHISDSTAKPPQRIAVIWVDELRFDEARFGKAPSILLKDW